MDNDGVLANEVSNFILLVMYHEMSGNIVF